MPLHSFQLLSPTAVLGLWHLTEAPGALWLLLPQAPTYRALLPPMGNARRQAQWLAGRVLIHALANKVSALSLTDFVVQNDATGRPWLAGAQPGPTVSLSHSGEWVAAVLALDGGVGVDVEIIRDKAQRLATKFLNPIEWTAARAAAAAAPAAAAAHYTLLWSTKETLYKLAAKRGITFKTQLLLDSFAEKQSGEIPVTLVLNGLQTRHCVCYCRPAPGYVLTYCYQPVA